jgi:hypothetical protein
MEGNTRLKVLAWCDTILDKQSSYLKKAIWKIQCVKADIGVARLKIRQERKKKNDSDQRKRNGITQSDTVH